jgi:alkanesulfonate monooxygenase SsuD/methylene tetrahydromethanopterin reductase-like flavin-dependent oxidoreductase (luciferase family)
MQASFFCTNGYLSREAFRHSGWPTPPALYRSEIGLQSLQAALAQAKLADDVGFDWVSCSEHHYTPLLQTPNAAVFAGALSQVVRRAKIAVLGPLVSMNNPVRIAEELAMLDQLSGGRLIVLFLRGTPNEFLAYDTNPDETRSRTQEASILIIRALTELQPFGWEGRHYRFRTVSVWPGPVQQPHPPMYYSGNSLESATFAAAHRLGLGISFYPPHMVAQFIGHYKQECARHGWEPSPDQLLYRCFAAVCEDDKEADTVGAAFSGMREAVESLMQGRGAALPRPPQSQVGLGLGELRFCGSPDTLVRQITDFHEATGVGVIDVGFAGDPTKAIRLFGTEVLPRIRHIGVRVSQPPELAVAAAD